MEKQNKKAITNTHEIMVTVDEVRNILSEAHISAEVEQNISRHFIEVTIEWGDWKHDHGRKKYWRKTGVTATAHVISSGKTTLSRRSANSSER